jgi:hypothetical protein
MINLGPRRIYGALLDYALRKNWRPGWAAFAFKEVFGTWPRDQDRAGGRCALGNFLIEEWAASRPKRPRRIPKPAPLVDAAERPPVKVDASGFVEGTLMTEEDFSVAWR